MTDANPQADLGANGAGLAVVITPAHNLPATLADSSDARLPATYEAARKAIAECERIDECKEWSDKGAALASYARQARDDSLKVMALRIQARAERRAGELLKQFPSASAANLVQHREVGAHPSVTRTQAAREAGLSAHQQKTAVRIASIPAPAFDRQVESPNPPAVTRLAEQGKATRVPFAGTASTGAVAAYSKGCDTLLQFVRFCERTEPIDLARGVSAEDVEAMRRYVTAVDQWLDRFVSNLAK